MAAQYIGTGSTYFPSISMFYVLSTKSDHHSIQALLNANAGTM